MHQESAAESKARSIIGQAINALQSRGIDVNAYSVAEATGLPRSLIVNNPSLMRLLAEARGESTNTNGHAASDEETKDTEELQKPGVKEQVEALQREAEQAAWENQVLRRYFQDSQAENKKLREELSKVQQEAQSMAKSVNVAWQQGYLAGQQAVQEAQSPSKSLMDSLADAAQAATNHGVTNPAADRQDDEPAASLAELVSDDSDEPDERDAYVADAPLHIEDPEVLNDPFTAKLLNALQSEQIEEEEEEAAEFSEEPLRQPAAPDYAAPGEAAHHPGNGTDAFEPDEQGIDLEDIGDLQPEDLMATNAEIEITNRFTAEELHNLFHNRYVRNEEPPEPVKPAATEAPPTTKKFVGTKHTSSEPLPPTARALPPEIRRACRLLGLANEEITKVLVLESWKREMSKPGVHPDTGGDTEMAIYLNTAKDTLLRWIEGQTPKLGKKFKQQPKPEQARPPQKQE